MSASPAFFDTNVLVYMIDAGEPRKRDRAREVFFEHAARRAVVLSTQVLLEFFWAATHSRRAAYPAAAAAGLVHRLAAFPVISPPRESVVRAIERATLEGLPVWDALIVEAAALAGAQVILSEDHHLHAAAFALGRSIRVADPFADL
jgi:predicted nucleic acid-binding protein